jgi:hypothetical protein
VIWRACQAWLHRYCPSRPEQSLESKSRGRLRLLEYLSHLYHVRCLFLQSTETRLSSLGHSDRNPKISNELMRLKHFRSIGLWYKFRWLLEPVWQSKLNWLLISNSMLSRMQYLLSQNSKELSTQCLQPQQRSRQWYATWLWLYWRLGCWQNVQCWSVF